MMLISDMALAWDPVFKREVLWYDRHRLDFRRDAAVRPAASTYLWSLVPESG